MNSKEPNLLIADLWQRHPGLTKALAECYREAATICLGRHYHPPIHFLIQDDHAMLKAFVSWSPPDASCLAAYANEIDATEWGAYACALASTELTRGLVALRRAETKTGADYYVALPGTSLDDLEECLRLEVSGTDKGTEIELQYRLLQKVDQARRGNSNLPALAAVVGFKAQKVAIKEVDGAP